VYWSECGPRDTHGHWRESLNGESLNGPVVTVEFCGIRGGGGGGKEEEEEEEEEKEEEEEEEEDWQMKGLSQE
jgi:hypothetical protein